MTQPASVPLGEMLQQSIKVMTKPSVQTFEEFENRGTMRDALIYVAVGAAIIGLLGLAGGIGPPSAALSARCWDFLCSCTWCISSESAGRYGHAGSGRVHLFAVLDSLTNRRRGGWPGASHYPDRDFLAAVTSIAALVVSVYFAYLATQSSLNMTDTTKLVITLLAGLIASGVVSSIVTRIFVAKHRRSMRSRAYPLELFLALSKRPPV